ncbi:AEC family transporter, partial [Oenococcus oeni]
VTLCLGYFSGARKDFGESHSKILNKLIMSYSLPMSLFGGILATGRKVIFENIPVAIWIFIGMVGGYLIVFSICKFILKNSTSLSALRSLTISGPAIPFVGPTLLGFLFPTETSLIVAIRSLIMNVVQVPLTVILLSTD